MKNYSKCLQAEILFLIFIGKHKEKNYLKVLEVILKMMILFQKLLNLKKLPDILKITNQSVDNTLTILVNNNKINNKKINEISSGIKILSAKTYDLDLEDEEVIKDKIKAKQKEVSDVYDQKQNANGLGEILKAKKELNEYNINLSDAEKLKREELKTKQDELTNQEDAIIKAIRLY